MKKILINSDIDDYNKFIAWHSYPRNTSDQMRLVMKNTIEKNNMNSRLRHRALPETAIFILKQIQLILNWKSITVQNSYQSVVLYTTPNQRNMEHGSILDAY